MKRTVPLLITAIVGFVLVCSAFVPAAESWGEKALIWFDLLAAIAFILGGANLVGSQLKKISARRKGWGYSAVTLIAFLVTLTVGVLKFGVAPAPKQEFFGESFASLAVDHLPVATFETPIPEELRREPLPASVRRQVSLTETGLRIAGWLTASQLADLSDANPTLDWQCAVQRLESVALPPAAFRGRLAYRPDHAVLSFKGVITDAEQVQLRELAPQDSVFVAAVDEVAKKSRREVTTPAVTVPPGFELPTGLAARALISADSLRWTGPMSPADRDALSAGALRSRIAFPLSGTDRQTFLAQLSDGEQRVNAAPAFPISDADRDSWRSAQEQGEKLTPQQLAALNQQLAFDRIVSRNWADELILAVNTAGVAKAGAKSACDLVAERNAGVTDLDPVIPAGNSIDLNEAQKEAIRSFVTAASHDWSALESTLRSAGPFNDAMAGAVTEFRSKLPTIGQRDRQLFDELIAAGPLTARQRDRLLQEFRIEHAWQLAVARTFSVSHEVKYPWSGDFLQPGGRFWWLFEYLYQPVQSMMFALLAFYVASAAFRAFRAKNIEASLLLGTAFIILLGRTYVGSLTTAWLPRDSMFRLENLSVDIMRVFNSAGNRAIMIGIALGIASTSLKILLGIDRSHIGGKD